MVLKVNYMWYLTNSLRDISLKEKGLSNSLVGYTD